MWRWMPWRFLIRRAAMAKGFKDPLVLLSHLRRFGQPSEVHEPWELLRAGALFHARGLVNSRAIQHNLDWVWPYWVERQFDPKDDAFVPRSFSITHINLTHRNWTAVGAPGCSELPIVDPRGLLTPLFDGWSLDAWVIAEDGRALIPSRLLVADQELLLEDPLSIVTSSRLDGLSLVTRVSVDSNAQCFFSVTGKVDAPASIVISLRPYNPEGISFVHEVRQLEDRAGWEINGRDRVEFGEQPHSFKLSHYRTGDVFDQLAQANGNGQNATSCPVGMATAAALFQVEPNKSREVIVKIPLPRSPNGHTKTTSAPRGFRCQVPDDHFRFLFDAAVRSLSLHSFGDAVFPGPYTYKRFWFRDAAFIVHALLMIGLESPAEAVLDGFPERQTPFGYFLSQEGEWDSNGEALWIVDRYCRLTGRPPKPAWRRAIELGADWIWKKRVTNSPGTPHQGLLPAGFSAEHLGLNDFYYWDDFWGIAGLQAAARLAERYADLKRAEKFRAQASDFLNCVEASLKDVTEWNGEPAAPASPYRRMDAGAIGSLVASYPLQLFPVCDPRIRATAKFLMEECFVDGGFFQDMVHSGINPYLTLHVAQVLLRDGDPRSFDLVKTVADLASPTGQWPEAVHPRTRGGCMGDGQHVWASAEWVLMLRNFFMREEGDSLILASGIPRSWRESRQPMSFGPAPTLFGPTKVEIRPSGGRTVVSWEGEWRAKPQTIEIHLPGLNPVVAEPGRHEIEVVEERVEAEPRVRGS